MDSPVCYHNRIVLAWSPFCRTGGVLTHQIEDVTSGYVEKGGHVHPALGVALAVALSIVDPIPQVQLWHYLLPGYIISIAMSYFVLNYSSA